MVYVLNVDGKPLMPTERHGKVRRLLKEQKAIVVNYHPFTIKLTYRCQNKTQEVSLGVDSGSKHVGFSATTKTKVLFEAQLELRNDIVKKLATRLEFRHSRRNRKTRYREPRFLNRRSSRKNGWLAPSIKNKVLSHIRYIERIKNILPISKINIEVAQFDTQLLKAREQGLPAPRGRDYQHGEQLGFWNTREYVLFRDNHKCQCCKGSSGDHVLNVHHIESRKTGGNAPNNLVVLCETCHKKYHNGEIKLPTFIKRGSSYKDAIFMGVVRKEVFRMLGASNNTNCPVSVTQGYITKNTRIFYGLPKSHTIDARCISGNPLAIPNGTTYLIKPLRKHNRQIHKATILRGGIRKNNQAPKEVFGFRLMDSVKYNGKVCFVGGRRLSGYFSLVDIEGNVLTNSVSYKKLFRINHNNNIIGDAISPTH